MQPQQRTLVDARALHHAARAIAAAAPSAAASSLTPPLSSSLSSSAPPPLRLAVLGAGLTGLSLAHQLQRRFREEGRGGVSIDVFDPRPSVGGWVQSASSKGFLMEMGPRSIAYRNDAPSRSITDLIAQLNLGPQVVLADSSAARRFVFNADEPGSSTNAAGKLVALPTSLATFWRFHLRSEILRQCFREFNRPPLPPGLPEDQSDESVYAWVTRRFGQRLADELVDPLMAGIYAGDPKKLSLQSTLLRFAQGERRSGSVMREYFWKNKTSESTRLSDEEHYRERSRELDRIKNRVADPVWLAAVKSTRIYSFQSGVGALTGALKTRLLSDSQDPHAAVLARKHPDVRDASVSIQTGSRVVALSINAANKPVLEISMAGSSARREFDHCFSTLPTHELHTLLAHERSGLPLAPEHRSSLLGAISPSATPFASVWVVHLIYSGDLLQGPARGFGLLVPSRHVLAGTEILGVTYDSCVFPSQNSGSQPKGETRLTVMIGGDRHPWLVEGERALNEETAGMHALRAVHAMMGPVFDPSVNRPLIVRALLNRQCIPQYYVGHAWRTNLMHQLTQHLAYSPSSYIMPSASPLPTFEVPEHEAAARAAPGTLMPLSLLGTNYGVSLNDCVHHATNTAKDFVERCTLALQVQAQR